MLEFRRLAANDLMDMERQPAQELWLGMSGECDQEQAELLASERVAWTAWRGDTVVACFGINETFPEVQGVAWALLSGAIGRDHVQLTRFIRDEIAGCDLLRLELLARAQDIEPLIADFPAFDSAMLVAAAMSEPTPECRWAALLGMDAAHLLRKFGAASETYMLFERIAE